MADEFQPTSALGGSETARPPSSYGQSMASRLRDAEGLIASLTITNQGLEDNNEYLVDKNRALADMLAEQIDRAARHVAENAGLKQELAQIKGLLGRDTDKSLETKLELGQAYQIIARKEEALRDARSRATRAERANASLEGQIEAFEGESIALREQLAEAREEVARLQGVEAANSGLTQQVGALTQTNRTQGEEIAILRAEAVDKRRLERELRAVRDERDLFKGIVGRDRLGPGILFSKAWWISIGEGIPVIGGFFTRATHTAADRTLDAQRKKR